MVIRPIAKVLENVIACAERRLADPIGPFATHLGKVDRIPFHPLHHIVTADAGIGARSIRDFGRRIVGTARTEIRGAGGDFGRIICLTRRHKRVEPRLNLGGATSLFDQHGTKLFGNPDRVQISLCREKLLSFAVMLNVTLVPAINPPTAPVVKQGFLDLDLKQLALFLNHDNQIEVVCPSIERHCIQWPDLPDLIGGNAHIHGGVHINAQQIQRMHQIKVILASSNKPDFRISVAPFALIHLIGTAKCLCGGPFVVDHPRLLQLRGINQTDVQPAVRQIDIGGNKLHPMRVCIHDGCDLNRVLHRFEADPDACIPRQGPRILPVV